jgi:putative ABC transport system permease protein
MNTVTRGARNAFRNIIRTGSIVIILSISIGLVIAMLSARQAVETKIEAVKSSVGNTVSISPAGVRGFEGGGDPLSVTEIEKINNIQNVTSVYGALSDRLTSGDTTDLESSVELGALGQRRANENSVTTNTGTDRPVENIRPDPSVSITISGIENGENASTFGGSTITWDFGELFDTTADKNEAVIGTKLATKNSLKVGDTFTAYGKSITVTGIYDAGTDFANNGVFVSLSSLQRLSDQESSVTSAVATVDSVDNLESATTAIESSLGDVADVTNNQETVATAISPLENVKTIALFSLIGAIVAGAIIILLTMVMIVRERRREVGVMKAIGASNIGIMKQFVSESITLTALALVVGTGIGIFASSPLADVLVSTSSSSTNETSERGGPGSGGGAGRGTLGRSLQSATDIQSSVGTEILLYGVGATLLIAILGSAIPSFMISKIKPAEAMRSE